MDTLPLPMTGCKIRPMTIEQGGDLNHLYHDTPALTQDLGHILIDIPMCVVRGVPLHETGETEWHNNDLSLSKGPESRA